MGLEGGPIRWGISIPQYAVDGTFEPAALRSYLGRAEALGFESAWTLEQVMGTRPHLGPIEVMSYAAACTERLRLGCAVFVSSLHSPVHLAKSIATLDQLSRGRVEVGLGAGGRFRMFSAFGVDPETFVGRFPADASAGPCTEAHAARRAGSDDGVADPALRPRPHGPSSNP